MNIETINQTINSTKYVGHDKKLKVVEGDITVPDIKPDILSIIAVDNEVYIRKQEVEDGKINIEGAMEVCVIYMSEDENGSLKSLNSSFNFYETINMDGVNEESILDLKTIKGVVECKVINGRKINIKSPITLNVNVLNNCEYSIAKDVVDDRNIELQKNNIHLKMLYGCKTEDIEIRENVSLNENCLPIGEVLKSTMKIINEDYKISYNKILAKADALVKIIYVADDERQSIEAFETTIPIMGFIDFDGINESMEICLTYDIKSFLIKPIYQDLKSLSFAIESDIRIKGCAYQKEEMDIISDIYNPDIDLKCQYEEVQILQNIINQSEDLEIMQGLLIPDLDNIKILNIEAKPNIINKNILDGKIALEGNIDFDILYFNESKRILENKKMELPFQQVIKIQSLQSNMNADVNITINNIEYKKVDGSQIQIRILAKVYVNVEKQDFINGIKNIDVIENELPNMPSIIIYYIKPGDTLWNIAKRFRTTVKEIMEYNNLKDENIYPNEQIIIPKRSKVVNVNLL